MEIHLQHECMHQCLCKKERMLNVISFSMQIRVYKESCTHGMHVHIEVNIVFKCR